MRAAHVLVLSGIALAIAGAYAVGAGASWYAIALIIGAWCALTIGAALTPPGDWTS